MAILITGFMPFADISENPSAIVARAVGAIPSIAAYADSAILPTEYDASVRVLTSLLDDDRYQACISLGVGTSAAIQIERVAYNIDDTDAPDNAGVIRVATAIDDAPETLTATLPINDLYAAIDTLDVPVELSTNAGRFVCNHLFYGTLHWLRMRGSRTRYGFIHLPMHKEAGLDGPSLPLGDMINAIAACMGTLQNVLQQARV